MQNNYRLEDIAESPRFTALVKTRLRISSLLSLLMVILYTLFLIGMAYFPQLMGDMQIIGASISFGIWCAMALCFVCLALSWYYTWWANNRFDVMKEKYLREMAMSGDAADAKE